MLEATEARPPTTYVYGLAFHRSSDHPISRVHEGNLLRWTSFVENGPLFSVAQR